MIYIIVEKNHVLLFDNFYNRKIPDKKSLDYKIALSLYDKVKSPYIVQTTIPDEAPSITFKKCWNDLSNIVFKHWFIIEPTTLVQQQDKIDAWWQVSNDLKLRDVKFYVCESGLENQFENTGYLDAYLLYEYNLHTNIVEELNEKNIFHKFLCFNKKIKPHRSVIVKHLLDHHKDDSFCTYTDGSILHFQVPMDENFLEYYNKAAIVVVNETNFYSKYQNYSEKTIDCILNGSPFILAAPPGTLSLLHDHGFKTFGDYWDESYDTICDHEKRLLAIKKTIYSVGKKSKKELEEMLVDMQDIRLYNIKNIKNIRTKLNRELERSVE